MSFMVTSVTSCDKMDECDWTRCQKYWINGKRLNKVSSVTKGGKNGVWESCYDIVTIKL